MRRMSMRRCRIRKTRPESDQEDDQMWEGFFTGKRYNYISNSVGKSFGGFDILIRITD